MSTSKSNDGAAKIYTKGGDKGKTSLIGGSRVSKGEVRLEAYGTIDELNSVLGLLHAEIATELAVAQPREGEAIVRILTFVQNDLFVIGSHLACEDSGARAHLDLITDEEVARLERAMDAYSAELAPLKHFILPGGSRSSSVAHIARTVCRRAERISVRLAESGEPGTAEVDSIIIQYMNRLSDYLFVLARHLNRLLGVDEPIWQAKPKNV